MMRWGLIPYWAKDIKVGFANINAKAEGIETKPAFRKAFEQRRCLVPVDNFYEWQKTATGKQPYAIALKSGGLMALAGLWENWHSPAGEWIRSFAIITTTPKFDGYRMHARPRSRRRAIAHAHGARLDAQISRDLRGRGVSARNAGLSRRRAVRRARRRRHLLQHDPGGVRQRQRRSAPLLPVRSSVPRQRGSVRAAAAMARVEVITGPERRRRWKRAIVAESLAPGAVVTEFARRAEICPGQIYH
jgi:hypothetical protein